MNAESFEEIIARCPHLDEEDKNALISDSKFLSEEERQSLVDELVHADQKLKELDKTNDSSDEELDVEMLKVLKEFEEKEVPQLIKNSETEDRNTASEEADKLLNTME